MISLAVSMAVLVGILFVATTMGVRQLRRIADALEALQRGKFTMHGEWGKSGEVYRASVKSGAASIEERRPRGR